MKVESALFNLRNLNFSTLFTGDIEFYLGAQYLWLVRVGVQCAVYTGVACIPLTLWSHQL